MCACACDSCRLPLTENAVKESEKEHRARKREGQPACDGCAASARRFFRWWTRFRKCRGFDRDFILRTMDRQDYARRRDHARRPLRRRRCCSHQIGWVFYFQFLFAAARDPLSPIGESNLSIIFKFILKIPATTCKAKKCVKIAEGYLVIFRGWFMMFFDRWLY